MELVNAEEGRAEQFSVGTKVLAIDDNQTCPEKLEDSDRENKDGEGSEHNGQEPPSTLKKRHRVVWTTELHKKFVIVVEQLGGDAVPKKILELMNVEGLTREEVASHLQKYRVCLRKVSLSNRNRSSEYSVSTNYNSTA